MGRLKYLFHHMKIGGKKLCRREKYQMAYRMASIFVCLTKRIKMVCVLNQMRFQVYLKSWRLMQQPQAHNPQRCRGHNPPIKTAKCDIGTCEQYNGGRKMEEVPKREFAFFVYHPTKKKLTPQQQKVKQISEISKVCLRKEMSGDAEALYKCAVKEARMHLASL